MNELMVDNVNKNKKMIADAIFEVMKKYSYDSKENLRKRIDDTISKVPVYTIDYYEYKDDLKVKTNYVLDIEKIADEIQKISGIRINNLGEKMPELRYFKFKSDKDSFNSLYYKYEKVLTGRVSPYTLENIYNQIGKDKFKILVEKIDELNKKYRFYPLKLTLSFFKHSLDMIFVKDNLGHINRLYGINSLDDIYDLYSKIETLLIDTKKLNEKQLEVVEKNRQNVLNTLGLKSIDESALISLKEELGVIVSNRTIEALRNSKHIDDIVKYMKWKNLNLNDLIGISNIYSAFSSPSVKGVFCDAKDKSIMVLNENLRYSNVHTQNNVITHEFVHSLEKSSLENTRFIYRYRALNECMTEYLSRKAMKNIYSNILEESNKQAETTLGYPMYEPIMSVLEETGIMEKMLRYKVDNKYKEMEKHFGRTFLVGISKCLNSYKNNRVEVAKKIIDMYKAREKVISKIKGR